MLDTEVDVLLVYPRVCGITTSLIDTALNLTGYVREVRCTVFVEIDRFTRRSCDFVRALNRSCPMHLLRTEFVLLNDIDRWATEHRLRNAIVSFGMLEYVDHVPFIADRLIVLDSGSCTGDRYLYGGVQSRYVGALPNVAVLGGHCHADLFPSNVYTVWRHKFSRERFEVLRGLRTVAGTFNELSRRVRNDGELDMSAEDLAMSALDYRRWHQILPGIYNENIGKAIFEFAALGRRVRYSPVNKTHDDGLTEYLAEFGINDNIEQEVTISEDELFDRLGMHEDDQLLRLLR